MPTWHQSELILQLINCIMFIAENKPRIPQEILDSIPEDLVSPFALSWVLRLTFFGHQTLHPRCQTSFVYPVFRGKLLRSVKMFKFLRIPPGTSLELSNLLHGLLRRDARERIDFETFFNHVFIKVEPKAPPPPPPPPPPTKPVTVPTACTEEATGKNYHIDIEKFNPNKRTYYYLAFNLNVVFYQPNVFQTN